ncbi:MAG TPA: heavy-metal-associated domain-containing protein [Flavobacterium sp.]|nr:heavy-metal-associated domain-containing protein [Flavobacterium sp.]
MKTTTFKSYIILAFAFFAVFQAQAQVSKVEIRATGLTCSMCSNAINKQLKALNEVDRVETDLNTNTFIVFFKENLSVAPKVLKEGVEKAGFFVGSMVLTTNSGAEAFTNTSTNDEYVFLNSNDKTAAATQFQILDKGYVTQKEFKKLSKTYSKHATYSVDNANDYHIKAF